MTTSKSGDMTWSVADVCQAHLEQMGEVAVPFLLTAALGSRTYLPVWTLKHIGRSATRALVELLRSPQRDVAGKAAVGLGELGAEEAIPDLFRLARDTEKSDEELSVWARSSIMRIKRGAGSAGSVPVPILKELEHLLENDGA